VIPALVSEEELQTLVMDWAKLNKWRQTHFRPARTRAGWSTPLQGDPGFPDLVAVRPGRLVFAELKSETGEATADQLGWLAGLWSIEEQIRARCNGWSPIETHLWRPSDWSQIEEVLR
jgi:hypothetical protein